MNLYTYCENDPINFLDPTGHYPEMVSYDPNNYSTTVAYLQEQLNKYNYGLAVDGIVGPQTWGSLLAAPAPKPTPTPTPTTSTNSGNSGSGGYVQYNPNTYNPEAKRVQQILNGKGASLKEDGYFGDNTLAAVQKFQRANGLDDDGIVGPKTWGMLLSNSSVYYGGSRSGRNNSRPAYEADEGTGKADEQINVPVVLYNYTNDYTNYSISSQNMLVDLTQKWFEAQTIDERNKIEVALIYFRAKVHDSSVDIFMDKTLNEFLNGPLGQIILYPTGLSELELDSRRDALLDSETSYIYAALSVKSSSGNSKIDYKKIFFEVNPDLKGEVVVHHGVEQQVLKIPETKGLFTEAEINAYENLRGIPKELNSKLHLSEIRKEWNRFYRENANPTKDEILNKRLEIDTKFGKSFKPPIE